MIVYFDFRDWWIGVYISASHVYVCLLPTLVFRFSRGRGSEAPGYGDETLLKVARALRKQRFPQGEWPVEGADCKFCPGGKHFGGPHPMTLELASPSPPSPGEMAREAALLDLVSRMEAVVRNPNENAPHSYRCVTNDWQLRPEGCYCQQDPRDEESVLEELRSLLPRANG